MKKLVTMLFLLIILYVVLNYKGQIIDFITVNFIDKDTYVLPEGNTYYKEYDYGFIQNTDNLYPSNKQDILNIIYSALNRGVDEFSFFCADGYNNCIDDVNAVADDKDTLSAINNFVHPYNSFRNISFSINKYGKVSIRFNKIYSESEILLINKRIDEISSSLFYPNISNYDKIRLFHDYLVNNTVYDDSVNIDNQSVIDTNSNTALGLLFDGKAVCSGYSDTMAIFLSRQGFNNYKISSEMHIWNLIYLDNSWKHIDVTWDDPVTSNGQNILIYDFFMIDTVSLLNKENNLHKNEHDFDRNYYIEAN